MSIVAFIDHLLFIELISFFKVIFPQQLLPISLFRKWWFAFSERFVWLSSFRISNSGCFASVYLQQTLTSSALIWFENILYKASFRKLNLTCPEPNEPQLLSWRKPAGICEYLTRQQINTDWTMRCRRIWGQIEGELQLVWTVNRTEKKFNFRYNNHILSAT